MTRLMIAALLFVLLSACQPNTPQPTDQPQPSEMPLATAPVKPVKQIPPELQPNGWSIRMTLSGGIAGVSRSVEITSTGHVTATDSRLSKTSRLQLGADELTSLKKLISEASFTTPAVLVGCSDCFIYQVEINSGAGEPFAAQVDDTSIDTSGMGPLVRYLNELMARAMKLQR